MPTDGRPAHRPRRPPTPTPNRAWCCWPCRAAVTATSRSGSRCGAPPRPQGHSTVALRGDLEGKVPTAPMLAGLPGCLALLVSPAPPQPFEETVFRPRHVAEDLVRHRPCLPGRRCCTARTTRCWSTRSARGRGVTGLPVVATGRRAHARAFAQGAAGRAEATAPEVAPWPQAGRAGGQCRSAPAFARAAGALYRPEWLHATLAASPAAAPSRCPN